MRFFKQPHIKTRINAGASALATLLVRGWMSTLRARVACYDPALDPACPDRAGQRIYIFWHEYLLLPMYMRGHCDLTILLSQHRDADVLAGVSRRMGYGTVRGSTTRGGATALRELLHCSQTQSLAMTPDGPKGPRRTVSQGPIYLASKLGLPIVPAGIGYDRPWRLRSWDRFAIPRPFSHVRLVIGPAVYVPSGLDRAELEVQRLRVENLMHELTEEAESWAASAKPRPGDSRLRPTQPRRGRLEAAVSGSMLRPLTFSKRDVRDMACNDSQPQA